MKTADESMIPRLKELWHICFGDSKEYIDMFFKYAFNASKTMVYTVNNNIAGACYLFPCSISGRRASYLYAGGVFPEYRRRGIYEEMMHSWSKWCHKNNCIPFLKPADDKLWNYYKKIGFSEFMGANKLIITNGGNESVNIKQISAEEFAMLRDEYINYPYIKWEHMPYIVRENEMCGGSCVSVVSKSGKFAMLYVKLADTLYIRGFAGSISALKNCADTLIKNYGVNKIQVFTDKYGEYTRLTAAVYNNFTIYGGAADLLMD